jgi:hypothetical protein
MQQNAEFFMKNFSEVIPGPPRQEGLAFLHLLQHGCARVREATRGFVVQNLAMSPQCFQQIDAYGTTGCILHPTLTKRVQFYKRFTFNDKRGTLM